ncbi:hypothetical protein [Lysinibacillus xylanilyticus]|uniref:ABC transporter domain-containing protein n=1 Tax=Lysinibacillus xylanilyticus TaxID=582475 RepID=A0ABT4EKD9_9BACI|nr:hypothetical protein [Lysinibacillus xylanilyticus]MCY9545463.1 hypothetical protein [Lysinibacillus xylanilyticus]
MEINQVYVKGDMRIGAIGISGKGKSTFLNHLIENDISNELGGLIGKKIKKEKCQGKQKIHFCYPLSTNKAYIHSTNVTSGK